MYTYCEFTSQIFMQIPDCYRLKIITFGKQHLELRNVTELALPYDDGKPSIIPFDMFISLNTYM